MSLSENREVVRRFWEGFNSHNLEVWDEICSEKNITHYAFLLGENVDLQRMKEITEEYLEAFPDLTSSEDDLLAEGDEVVTRMTFTGTHKGEFMGIAPSGKKISITGIFIDKLKDGKIVEAWAEFDNLEILRQIGAEFPKSH